jgi:hypothetical protein
MDKMSPEDIFAKVDHDSSGAVSAEEGFNALYCMVEWDEMKEDEARFLYQYLGDHANHNPDGTPDELDFDEAMYAMNNLEDMMKQETGDRPMPFDDPPNCPEKPEKEPESVEDAFHMIDQDGSGKLSAREGFDALYCLVVWEVISEDEAFQIYDHVGSHAGDDDEVEMGEFKDAVGELMEMHDM